MNYEDALKAWGYAKLCNCYPSDTDKIDPDTVNVSLEMDAGYACCGGRDPDCYCSFAESPYAYVEIHARLKGSKKQLSYQLGKYGFDFATFLKEIVSAAGGMISEEQEKTDLNKLYGIE